MSATSLVWSEGMIVNPNFFKKFWPLADFITLGDTGSREFQMVHSYLMGMHADLQQFKRMSSPTDREVLYWGFAYLDRKREQLEFDEKIRNEIGQHIWHQYGNEIVLLGNSTAALTRAANERYPVVIFFNEGEETNTIGIQRQPGLGISMGDIVQHILDHHGDEPGFREELEGDGREYNGVPYWGWYRHESGFFAGRGTKVSPTTRPISIDMNSLVEFVGQAYLHLMKKKGVNS